MKLKLERRKFSRNMLVPVSSGDADWGAKAMKIIELKKEEEEIKANRRDLNHQMKKVVGAGNQLMEEMEEQSVRKEVSCEEIKNFSHEEQKVPGTDITVGPGQVVIVRLDTKQIIESRTISNDEAQTDMFAKEDKTASEPEEAEEAAAPQAEEADPPPPPRRARALKNVSVAQPTA